jgi:hypothetical protein
MRPLAAAHQTNRKQNMSITINETLRAYIDPLTGNEYAALERSLLAEGCRDALVLWGEVLIDGHNRYAICRQHDIPFRTVQNDRFASIEDVQLWMIDNHLARRSVSDFQRGVLALRKKEIVAARAVVPAPFRSMPPLRWRRCRRPNKPQRWLAAARSCSKRRGRCANRAAR